MAMSETEVRAAIEAILFVAGEPVKLEDLSETFDEEVPVIAAHIEAIRSGLGEKIQGFTVEETAGGFRLATRPEQDPALRKFFAKRGEGRLSIAALETLAIIAYRQPITAPEISELRGVNTTGVLRTLLERRMIRIAGRKNVVGSPFLYRTTRDFLIHFGLNEVQDLPKLDEFSEILGENMTEELFQVGTLEEPVAHVAIAGEATDSESTPAALEEAPVSEQGPPSSTPIPETPESPDPQRERAEKSIDQPDDGFDDWESEEPAGADPEVKPSELEERAIEGLPLALKDRAIGEREPPLSIPNEDARGLRVDGEISGDASGDVSGDVSTDVDGETTQRTDGEVTVESVDTGKTD